MRPRVTHGPFACCGGVGGAQVGNWVGHQRWVLVDLTAGGFDWGPALGGEGVVHKHSLPSVMDHFAAVQDLRERECSAAAAAAGTFLGRAVGSPECMEHLAAQ